MACRQELAALAHPNSSVGIFWAVQELGSAAILVDHRCTLKEAETYGSMLTCAHGHYEIWEQWRKDIDARPAGFTAAIAASEYEEWPRGRIVYDTESDRFIVYADAQILRRTALLGTIHDRFGLSADRAVAKRDDKPTVTESDLEEAFVALFRSTAGRIFMAWSAQNVDRTVTLYRACLKTGRTLVVDLYTAEVMDALADFGKLPRPGWKNLKVVITSAFARLYRRTGRDAFVERMAKHGISAGKLAETPGQWVVMVRPSLIRDYAPKGVIPNPDDAWCWSMWQGYLKNEDGSLVRKWFENGGSHTTHIHTSGHASPADLRSFAQAMNAKNFVPIHGLAWDRDTAGFESIRRLADGESMAL